MERLFGGLELFDPGVVPVHRRRPDGSAEQVQDRGVGMYGGVAPRH